MDISTKYSCAHSHVWATGHSNLNLYSCSRVRGSRKGYKQVRLSFFNIMASSNDLLQSFSESAEERNNARAARRAAPDHTCTD